MEFWRDLFNVCLRRWTGGSPDWEFRLSQNQVILHPGFKCCCVMWDNTTREMLLPHHYTVSGVTWTCSKTEQNWFIKDLSVVIDAEIHGVLYFHVVPCVFIMLWQPKHQVCCTSTPWDSLEFQDGWPFSSPTFSFIYKLRSQYKKILICVQS